MPELSLGSLALPWLPAVVLAMALVVAVASRSTRRRKGVRVVVETAATAGAAPWKRALGASTSALRLGSLAALTIFVSGPRRTVDLPGDPARGVGMMVALDVSGSMGRMDADGMTRLQDAVAETRRFLQGRKGDRVGLVTFGAEALVRVPPTGDRRPLLDALASVKSGEDGDATAIGTALGLAAARLRALQARSKVIVLLTDGRSNAGALDPLTAARAASALGQKIYVVEVGGSAADASLLSRIARVGGGRRWVVADGAGAQAAYRDISALEPSTFPGPTRTASVPTAGWLLWLAAAMLLAERGLRGAGLGRIA